MARTESTMPVLGSKAPSFSLADTLGKVVRLEDFSKPLLIMFICNHCPFVKHIAPALTDLARDYHGVIDFVAINANDVESYPEDSPEKMKQEKALHNWPFPYLFDQSQEIAKAYRAACTPDFFLYDSDRSLVYRGQFDDSRPGNQIPVTGKDIRAALDAISVGEKITENQKPSLGCNIKWKAGNVPEY